MEFKHYFGILIFGLIITGMIGWVLNIIKLLNSDFIPSGLDILRVVGIFIAPLGAIIGFI